MEVPNPNTTNTSPTHDPLTQESRNKEICIFPVLFRSNSFYYYFSVRSFLEIRNFKLDRAEEAGMKVQSTESEIESQKQKVQSTLRGQKENFRKKAV